MPETAEKLMTVAEFLEWDDGTDTRYELVRGKLVPLARPTPAHSVIVTNIGGAVCGNLKPRFYLGTSVAVVPSDRDDTCFVADVVASCTRLEAEMATIPQPEVIIEVLLAATAEHDRSKMSDYRRIASVREIALFASEQGHVEVWRRRGATWEVEDLIGDAALELEAVGVRIPFAAIYADSGV
jgi:Uma2 family endonuclease